MMAVLATLTLLGTPTFISNVRVEVGDGTVIDNTSVLFDNGRISAVGAVRAPSEARRMDGHGRVLTPGFIHSASYLGVLEVELEPSTDDTGAGEALSPGFRVADGFNPSSVFIPLHREEGVTSAIVRPYGGILGGTGSWIDLTGQLASRPDTSNAIAMFGGVGENAIRWTEGSRGSVWLALREAFADARFYTSHRDAVDRGQARELSLTPVHLDALQPVLTGRIPLVLYADRASDILTAIEFAKREKVRLIISGGREAWRVAKELSRAKVPVIIEPSTQVPRRFESIHARNDNATLLHAAGVKLVIGSGQWEREWGRRARQEAGIAVKYGLPHAEAIRALTLTPAQAFGKGRELGSVTKGKRANLVLWSGDPLEVTSYAESIWIDGVEQPMDSRQRQLFERYAKKKAG